MNLKRNLPPLIAIVIVLLSFSCKKDDNEGIVYSNNNAPYYDGLPTVLVQNYVNRLFIDLIGREPLDEEMEYEVQKLKDARYGMEARDTLIRKLQDDKTFIEGDSSYKRAYHNRIYELFKVRMLEGASDADIEQERSMIYGNLVRDSLAGDWYNAEINLQKVKKLDAVLAIDYDYYSGRIEINEAFARLLDNAVYDRINMNTFNFINASFNDLFNRFPSNMEFENAYNIVEFDKPQVIFGETAANKGEFIQLLVNSKEFYEGMIRWTYGTLLVREPLPSELELGMSTFFFDHNLQNLQLFVLKTDEYANFIQ